MTSKSHNFKNAVRMHASELICSTGVLGFQTLNSFSPRYFPNMVA